MHTFPCKKWSNNKKKIKSRKKSDFGQFLKIFYILRDFRKLFDRTFDF